MTPEPTSTKVPTPAATTPAPTVAPVPTTRPGFFSREQLIEDARQLADIIEGAHPDPYIRGGGKIAFHLRLHQLLEAIPEGGMTRDGFVRLLRPFVAAIGDSHTSIWDVYRVNNYSPGGVPLRFGVVEESLYVAGVPRGVDSDLIGAVLVSVEGVPVSELCERQKELWGTENPYHALQLLAYSSLWYRPYMEDLLPEWQDERSVTVELQLPSGEVREMAFDLPKAMNSLSSPGSQVTLPATDDSGFLYEFLDAEGKTAYLRVDHMQYYREAYEIWATAGSRPTTEEERARIKSATETFRDLVVEMEEAGTETLIVDLRDNEGGNSLMSDILLYFLHDREDFLAIMTYTPAAGGGEVRRYSHLYFENCPNESIEDYNEGRAVPLVEGDYCFDADFTGDAAGFQELVQGSETPAFLDGWYQMAPTFYTEYESGVYGGYYRPGSIVVLVTPRTFSSGFTLSKYLYLAGAVLVGTPPAQAANCFGETLEWRLDNTAIRGSVSGTHYNTFPNDPELGRVLPVQYPLTYDKLASYGFDPNAEYLYALELLPEVNQMPQAPIATAAGQEPSTPPPEVPREPTSSAGSRHYGREELIEDARQLADAIETAHPDPYINGGGRVAFHRRLQRLLKAIPDDGMTRDAFIRLLRPFVAAVGDSHTDIWDDYRTNDYAPGGVPLVFGIVEESLYVAGVPQGVDEDLIGAILVSVEGVPMAELCERQRQVQGTENHIHVLYLLARFSLWYRPFMEDLLPEWSDTSRVSVTLQRPTGEKKDLVFDLPKSMDRVSAPESQVSLPSPDDSGFLYEFLDAEGEIAYLRITHLTRYREATEMATNRPAPHLHSATETFRSMVVEMEQAGTDTLIIDLRGNQGGHSVMGDILTYFLYGKETLHDIMTHAGAIGGGMVRKYSDLFWSRTQSWTSLEQVNEGRALPLRAQDYDFAGFVGDAEWSPEREAEAIAYGESVWLSRSPTFWEEYQSEAHSGYFCPENIVVLVDSGTFSSGFNVTEYLYLAGATLIGTPSGQASNSFGNGQLWRLDHTGIEGSVSTSYGVKFPDDSELARILPVHHPLTYDRLASYGFDPNAEYLYALELLSE
jgi:hypothetical protein